MVSPVGAVLEPATACPARCQCWGCSPGSAISRVPVRSRGRTLSPIAKGPAAGCQSYPYTPVCGDQTGMVTLVRTGF